MPLASVKVLKVNYDIDFNFITSKIYIIVFLIVNLHLIFLRYLILYKPPCLNQKSSSKIKNCNYSFYQKLFKLEKKIVKNNKSKKYHLFHDKPIINHYYNINLLKRY